ncbi:helix-turn-helix transcriptional regulator [Burkholderia sp. RS02]|uniref:helix-turn-helix domain-containing protein n=1 Tax=unclassified Burkholderia TaxID=2613784 RepID=UPI003218B1AB
MTIGARLREERERLGLNQTKFGELGGVSKKAQIDYEKNVFSPNARYLEAVANGGADVLYILTGMRIPTATGLSRDEEALLDNYRHSAPEDKAAIRKIGSSFAQHDGGGECNGGKTRAQRRCGNES